jgi:hypothetical protein
MKRRGGKSGPRKVIVPNLSGRSRSQAQADLSSVGLSYSESSTTTSSSGLNLSIESQSVAAGSTVLYGSSVPFVYYNYVEPCVSNAGQACGYYSDGVISCSGSCVGATPAPSCTAGYTTDWTYSNITWSGTCSSNSESGTATTRVATYRYSDCSTTQITETGSYSVSRYCAPTCSAGYLNDWTYSGATWSGSCVNNSESGTYSSRSGTYRYSDCSTTTVTEYGTYSTSRYCTPTCTPGYITGYTYGATTWSGTCSGGTEGGTAQGRSATYQYSNCSTAVITEQGPFYVTRTCTVCTCNYTSGGTSQSYHFSPDCCPSGSPRTGSLSGSSSAYCCPDVAKTSSAYVCKSYDVNDPASTNYYNCFSVGACSAPRNPDGSRAQCWP